MRGQDTGSVAVSFDGTDTSAVDWATVALPDAWPDRLRLRRPAELWRLTRRLFGRRRRVEVPAALPGGDALPEYLRHEFHHLPNGNYSKRIVRGYVRAFDAMMLGRARAARRDIARRLAGCRRVLDVGCGSGGLAGELVAAGVPDVQGLDPSPYLLREAALRHPGVGFAQGVGERNPFPARRFDGAGACFVFHELPPEAGDETLAELHRVLVPHAPLVLVEPSPLQFRPRELGRFLRKSGLAGLYFWLMALTVYEPFAGAWHRRDVPAWLDAHGFDLQLDEIGMPLRTIVAVRRA